MNRALLPGEQEQLLAAGRTAARIRTAITAGRQPDVAFADMYGFGTVIGLADGRWRARGGGFTATATESGRAAVLNWLAQVEGKAAGLVHLSDDDGCWHSAPQPTVWFAICYRSGEVFVVSTIPGGCFVLVSHHDRDELTEVVSVAARDGYDGQTLLVPGLPEATDHDGAAAAALQFQAVLRRRLEGKARS